MRVEYSIKKPIKVPVKKKSYLKLILTIIASSILLLFLSVTAWVVYFNSQFKVYQDDQYKFSIRYYNTWKVVVHPRQNVAVVFLRPKDSILDNLQENFNVTVQPLPKGVASLEELSARIKGQMISVFGTNTRFVEYKPYKWSWGMGYKMSIEAPKPDDIKLVNAWVLNGNQSYILTFLGNIKKYRHDYPVVNAMIRSLQLQ